jgi:short-subunit dehydrogenase
LPRIRAHGEGGHIVNTASMAGLECGMGFSPYATSKHAVMALSEGLAWQVEPHGIGVTVLCPGFVQTAISGSARNRSARYGPAPLLDPNSYGGKIAAESERRQQTGLDPEAVANLTLRAIENNDLYVFTHPEMFDNVRRRFGNIEAAMDRAAE